MESFATVPGSPHHDGTCSLQEKGFWTTQILSHMQVPAEAAPGAHQLPADAGGGRALPAPLKITLLVEQNGRTTFSTRIWLRPGSEEDRGAPPHTSETKTPVHEG